MIISFITYYGEGLWRKEFNVTFTRCPWFQRRRWLESGRLGAGGSSQSTGLPRRSTGFCSSQITAIETHVWSSMNEIRRQCTSALGQLDHNSSAHAAIRGLRAACRRFVDSREEFQLALGECRGVVGLHFFALSAAYKLPVEDELASIVPQELGSCLEPRPLYCSRAHTRSRRRRARLLPLA